MLSLFEKDQDHFYNKYKDAEIDVAAFYKLYKYCDIIKCEAVCCSGGVTLSSQERKEISDLIKAEPEYFKAVNSLEEVFIEPEDKSIGGYTALKTFKYNRELPQHFEETRCIFLNQDSKCSLQQWSAENKPDSWWYKPFYCWMFPMTVMERNGKTIITICSNENEPANDAFAEYTVCGSQFKDGRPAYITLEREIQTLGKLLKRDVLAEILAAKVNL